MLFYNSVGPNPRVVRMFMAEREKKWSAFATDPEWLSARAKTEEDGQIVASVENLLLAPTAFSSVR